MQYYFHLVSQGSVSEDAMGENFSTIEEALAYAHVLATKLGGKGGHEPEQAIIVANAKGEEIALVPGTREGPAGAEDPHPYGASGSEPDA